MVLLNVFNVFNAFIVAIIKKPPIISGVLSDERKKEKMEIKIRFTPQQRQELLDLRESEVMEVMYKGLPAYITRENACPNFTIDGNGYLLNFYCPYEVKACFKRK